MWFIRLWAPILQPQLAFLVWFPQDSYPLVSKPSPKSLNCNRAVGVVTPALKCLPGTGAEQAHVIVEAGEHGGSARIQLLRIGRNGFTFTKLL